MPKLPSEPKHRAPPVAPSPAAIEKGEAPAIDSDDDTDDEGKGGSHKESSGVAEKRRSTNSNLVLVAAASKVNKKIKHVCYQHQSFLFQPM
jgi:hypothetical protein